MDEKTLKLAMFPDYPNSLGTKLAQSACMETMNQMEMELTKLMIAIVVRYPDGLDRIESCLDNVIETGEELGTLPAVGMTLH